VVGRSLHPRTSAEIELSSFLLSLSAVSPEANEICVGRYALFAYYLLPVCGPILVRVLLRRRVISISISFFIRKGQREVQEAKFPVFSPWSCAVAPLMSLHELPLLREVRCMITD